MESCRPAFRALPLLLAAATLGGLLPARLAAAAAAAADAPKVPSPAAAAPAPSYDQEIAAWHSQRIAGLKRKDGWLSLVGLFWLDEGENRFGSGAGNKVIFPEGSAPVLAGTLERHGKSVRLHAAPGVVLTHEGKPIDDIELTGKEGPPFDVGLGRLDFFIIQRGDRVGVRVRDTESPTFATFKDIETYPAQPAWRVAARFEPYNPPKQVAIPNILGQVEDTPSPGAVVFERDGRTYRIDALEGGKDGSLFLIFGDLTNHKETYGGGRFLDSGVPKDGKVVVDFNQAYNPPCAFTAFATCPLPPKQNQLGLKVEAGEKKYGAGHP